MFVMPRVSGTVVMSRVRIPVRSSTQQAQPHSHRSSLTPCRRGASLRQVISSIPSARFNSMPLGASCIVPFNPYSSWSDESPVCRQGVGRQFRIFNSSPCTISEMGMCQLVGDYIMSEILRATCQEGLKNHASTAVCRCGACHPDRASLAGNKIIQRDTKARVIEEFAENRVWQPLHDRYDARREGTVPDRALDVATELLNAINC